MFRASVLSLAVMLAMTVAAGTVPVHASELAQNSGSGVNENGFNSEAGGSSQRPRKPPVYTPRKFCIIDSDRFCLAPDARVGGVCRCSGMTGSGRVVVR